MTDCSVSHSSFSPGQSQALSAPLDRKHVTQRNQSGMRLDYIEGWHAISEANRIFGFDGWDRETADLVHIGDEEVNGKWRVRYRARVRIYAGGRFRDGTGYGSGIAKDLGDAHESAIKEAETDATKRALMTFGNPFGLALYDKTRANVSDGGAQTDAAKTPPPPKNVPKDLQREKDIAWSKGLIDLCATCKSVKEIDDLWKENKDKIDDLEKRAPDVCERLNLRVSELCHEVAA